LEAGCADTVLVLSRASQGTSLYVRGRDIEEAEHAVSFDKHSCRWTVLGDAGEIHRSSERAKIMAVLSEEPIGPAEISSRAGMPRNNVDQLLFKMVEANEVERIGRGKYRTVTPCDDDLRDPQ
jgi:predicted Rossmann fold nucleotide-binding protein DprA/Smf involved in DNA uptake